MCGYGLGEFVVLVGATATAILLLGRIRSRSKLIKVGFFTGLATSALSLITGLLEGQSLAEPLWELACAQWFVGVRGRLLRDRLAALDRSACSAC